MTIRNVIVYSRAGRGYAIELRWVREVFTLGHITPVPTAPPSIVGAVNFRGAIMPVLDVHALIASDESDARLDEAHQGQSAIVIEVEMARCAIGVDTVDEVSSLHPDDSSESDSSLIDSRGRHVTLLEPPAIIERCSAAVEQVAKVVA